MGIAPEYKENMSTTKMQSKVQIFQHNDIYKTSTMSEKRFIKHIHHYSPL